MFGVVASIDGQRKASVLVAVGQPASIAKLFKLLPCLDSPMARLAWSPPVLSLVCGVGQPVEPVSDMRSTDARRRKRDRPDPVSQAFQVILYKVDPRICVAARNLLSKDDCRAALADEVEEVRP
jgi:hypothetical protein